MKGEAVKTIMGACRSSREYRSYTLPPATERKAEPEKPSRKRETRMVAMFWATAEGMIQMMKKAKETKYMGRLP